MSADAPTQSAGRSSRFFLIAVGLVGLAIVGGWAYGTLRNGQKGEKNSSDAVSAADLRKGELVYRVYCASCHGMEGQGDGPSAAQLKPTPRDFAARPWKTSPTMESIRNVTKEGIRGTAMASFGSLPAEDLDAVVAYVYRFATAGPSGAKIATNERPVNNDEQLITQAGFTNLKGMAPPPLILTDAKGKTVRLSDYAGSLILLHFWGTTCTHCVKEIPALDLMEKQYDGRLKVLNICTDEEDPIAAQKHLDKIAPGATALTESSGLGLARYEVQALPTVWLIAPDGTAIARSSGAKDWSDVNVIKLIVRWIPTPR